MSLLTKAIIGGLEEEANMLLQVGYRAKPEASMLAQNKLRKVVESLDFFSAPQDCFIHYLSAYNVLSIYLFAPEEIAENCLDLFIMPRVIDRELKKFEDEKVRKRRLLGYILDESHMLLSEQKPTLEITPQDAHYLKLIQSMARVDIHVARGYSEVYNKISKIKLSGKKVKRIVEIPGHNDFGIALE